MKGCLSLIIKTAIAVLVFFGLKYIGAVDFLEEKLHEHSSADKKQVIEAAKETADLSEIDSEYTVDKNFKILKNKVILIQHKASGQKTVLYEPENPEMLKKQDLTADNIQEKIDNFIQNNKIKFLKNSRVKAVKQGSFKCFGQTAPYAAITAEIANLPVKDIEGIIAAAETPDKKTLIIISFNEKNKYSRIITEALLAKIKFPEKKAS